MRPAHVNRRRDTNEPQIIATLRAVGATVVQLSGPNIPDLLVGYRGKNWVAEVKIDVGELNEGQKAWARNWCGDPVHVLRTPEDALWMIGVKAR